MTVAAPVIEREMDEWEDIGGFNLGIVGNEDHEYGFHRGADEVPSDDYSRRRDPNGSDGPFVNWNYACAGDFGHNRKPELLKATRRVLAELMDGKYPMVCEFIGQPWDDRPVYYWARWNGIKTLKRYTGSGHDKWNHIAWYRSKVDQYAGLWISNSGGEVTDMFCKHGDRQSEKVRALQRPLYYDLRIYTGKIDGWYGAATAAAVKELMKRGGQKSDGMQFSDQEYTQLQRQVAETAAKRVADKMLKDLKASLPEVNLPDQIVLDLPDTLTVDIQES